MLIVNTVATQYKHWSISKWSTSSLWCANKRESRTVAPWSIGSSMWLSTALTGCLPAPPLPLWPPLTSPVRCDSRDVLRSYRGVCICLPAIVLSCIYIWGLLCHWPGLTYIGRREESPPSATPTFLLSGSVWSPWSSHACLPSIKTMVCVCYSLPTCALRAGCVICVSSCKLYYVCLKRFSWGRL